MQKWVIFLLSSFFCTTALATPSANEAYEYEYAGNYFRWRLESDGTVSLWDSDVSGAVSVPSSVQYSERYNTGEKDNEGNWIYATHVYTYQVSVLGNHYPGSVYSGAFKNNTRITSVSIPSGISIDTDCFSRCTSLESVSFPSDMKSIPYACFSGCTGLSNYSIPDSVKSIGAHAFDGCSGLTSVTIPNSVTSSSGTRSPVVPG